MILPVKCWAMSRNWYNISDGYIFSSYLIVEIAQISVLAQHQLCQLCSSLCKCHACWNRTSHATFHVVVELSMSSWKFLTSSWKFLTSSWKFDVVVKVWCRRESFWHRCESLTSSWKFLTSSWNFKSKWELNAPTTTWFARRRLEKLEIRLGTAWCEGNIFGRFGLPYGRAIRVTCKIKSSSLYIIRSISVPAVQQGLAQTWLLLQLPILLQLLEILVSTSWGSSQASDALEAASAMVEWSEESIALHSAKHCSALSVCLVDLTERRCGGCFTHFALLRTTFYFGTSFRGSLSSFLQFVTHHMFKQLIKQHF